MIAMYPMRCKDCRRVWASTAKAMARPCAFCGSENVKRGGKR